MSTVWHYLGDHWTAILGVLGFFISAYNFGSGLRSKTVHSQAEILAELRGYIDLTVQECQNVKHRLGFDRYQLHLAQSGEAPKPQVPPRPEGFDTALEKMPELAFTITSIGQKQIEMLVHVIGRVHYDWGLVNECLDAEPLNVNVLEFSGRLKRYCLVVEKFFPDYADAARDINKGNLWKRFRYRDHRPFVYKLCRWTPLDVAINEYDRALRGE